MNRRELIEGLKEELERLMHAANDMNKTIVSLEHLEWARRERSKKIEKVFKRRKNKGTGPGSRMSLRELTSDTSSAEEEETNATLPTDRDGSRISVGDFIHFLTKGKHPSSGGVVIRFSKNKDIVYALEDWYKEIARAPHNVRVGCRN